MVKTKCALFWPTSFYTHTKRFHAVSAPNGNETAFRFLFTYKFIDDVLSINNQNFGNSIGQVYPVERTIYDREHYFYSNIYYCQFEGMVYVILLFTTNTRIAISTNFPFPSSRIPSLPPYIFFSQLKRYTWACSAYEGYILIAWRLSNKLLTQRYIVERLKSSFRNYMVNAWTYFKRYEVSLSRMFNDIMKLYHLQVLPNWSDFS